MNHKLVLLTGMLFIASQCLFADSTDESLKTLKPELTAKFIELLNNADEEKGAAYFDRKCSVCHTAEEGGAHFMGPALWNWFGRQAGTEAGFEYSEAMVGSGHVWDIATLNYYLTNTEKAVPGRIMNFRGIKKDKQRAGLIRYLVGVNKVVPELPKE